MVKSSSTKSIFIGVKFVALFTRAVKKKSLCGKASKISFVAFYFKNIS